MEFGINIRKTISSLIPSLLQITFFISDEVGVVECLHHRVVSERETMSEKKFRFFGAGNARCCRLVVVSAPTQTQLALHRVRVLETWKEVH